MKASKATKTLGRAPRIAINVNQGVIDDGVARNSNHCMVAEALKESYPELKYVAVDIQTIRATDREKQERYVWLTPRSVQRMIIDFDRGVKPKPFRVEFRDGQTTESGKSHLRKKKSSRKLRQARGGNIGTVPERVGGRTPPRSVGQRRAFGLRRLQF